MTTKLAISLPDDLVAEARAAVRAGRAASVSAYIADALRVRSSLADVAALLADMTAETGPPDDDDRAWARAALGIDAR
jgi:Arc/MetJ-type ribon-helix-helix transcriptional regulator